MTDPGREAMERVLSLTWERGEPVQAARAYLQQLEAERDALRAEVASLRALREAAVEWAIKAGPWVGCYVDAMYGSPWAVAERALLAAVRAIPNSPPGGGGGGSDETE